jgi:hypothetical protein
MPWRNGLTRDLSLFRHDNVGARHGARVEIPKPAAAGGSGSNQIEVLAVVVGVVSVPRSELLLVVVLVSASACHLLRQSPTSKTATLLSGPRKDFVIAPVMNVFLLYKISKGTSLMDDGFLERCRQHARATLPSTISHAVKVV